MSQSEPLTKAQFEESMADYQGVILEAVDTKFKDIETHLSRIEESLDKTYGRILERHEGLLTQIARKLGLEEKLE